MVRLNTKPARTATLSVAQPQAQLAFPSSISLAEVLGMALTALVLVAALVLGTLAANALAASQYGLPRAGISVTVPVPTSSAPVGYEAGGRTVRVELLRPELGQAGGAERARGMTR